MPNNRTAIGTHAKKAVSEMQAEFRELGHRATERVDELRETARDRATTLQHVMEKRIVKSPLKAVLIAAGIGMVFGFLWRR
jgi:ElaB/YqjD/DUF883 family membrane-anchored ribosome-binding protein